MDQGKQGEPSPAGNDGTSAGTPARGGRGKLIAILAAAVLIAGGGAGAHFSGLLGGDDGEAAGEASGVAKSVQPPAFYPLPEMIVTINTGERKSTFLKLKLSIEIGDAADASRIDPLLPRVTDACQVFLRDLRPDDLQGSAGTARLRTELLRRISLALAPIPVNDVLIAEILTN